MFRLEWRVNFAQTFRYDGLFCVLLGPVQTLIFPSHRTIPSLLSAKRINCTTMITTMIVVAFAGFHSASRISHFNRSFATVGDGVSSVIKED